MHMFVKLAAGAAAIGGLAAPALAQSSYPYQSYPVQQPYPGYQQPAYGYGQQGYAQNPVGAIIGQLLGNRYNVTDRTAVTQCASAAMAQAAAQYGNGYNQGYGYNGYNRGYDGAMRVTSITDVQRRHNGLRVSGLMSSGYGAYANQGYVDPRYAARGNLSFRCSVDYRGAVTNLRIRRA